MTIVSTARQAIGAATHILGANARPIVSPVGAGVSFLQARNLRALAASMDDVVKLAPAGFPARNRLAGQAVRARQLAASSQPLSGNPFLGFSDIVSESARYVVPHLAITEHGLAFGLVDDAAAAAKYYAATPFA